MTVKQRPRAVHPIALMVTTVGMGLFDH